MMRVQAYRSVYFETKPTRAIGKYIELGNGRGLCN